MTTPPPFLAHASADRLADLRAELASVQRVRGPVLPFDLPKLDERLALGGLESHGLHEVAAATSSLTDDAAATLFMGGIAARFATQPAFTVLWAVTCFDLYAPGLEQVGLGPERILYAQGRKDADVLALAEDGLRDGSLACVIAEVKQADRTATRRLQLAASDGKTPIGVKMRPFAAHAWVQSGHWLVNDRIDTVRAFTPIMAV